MTRFTKTLFQRYSFLFLFALLIFPAAAVAQECIPTTSGDAAAIDSAAVLAGLCDGCILSPSRVPKDAGSEEI